MKPLSLTLISGVLLLAASCQSEKLEPSDMANDAGEAGAAGSPAGPEAFGASPCRTCQAAACRSPEDACFSEPECASYLECLDACPVAPDGGLDAACADACTLPGAAEPSTLAATVTECRERGAGSSCECGAAPTHPFLAQECSPSVETNPCWRCEDEKCCETYAACEADAECDAYIECVRACPSATFVACEQACGAQHESGFELGLRRQACVALQCSDETTCGEQPLSSCAVCMTERCLDEQVACLISVPCSRAGACIDECGNDAACGQACLEDEPQGGALLLELSSCTTAHCASECG